MTYYDELTVSYVEGLIPQLVLCCIYQEITNRRYIAESLEIDYASGSINLGIQVTNDPLTIATLQLDISFPIAQQSPLLKRQELAERVSSVTDLHTDNIAIAREVSYPRVSDYPVPAKPTYLSGRNDTLERRIVWLCQQIINLDSWLAEWNQLALICEFVIVGVNANNTTVTQHAGFIVIALRTLAIPFMLLPDTIALDDESAITAYTDHLISQLTPFPAYREVPYVPDYALLINIPVVVSEITVQGEIQGVESESSFVDSFVDSSQQSSPSELEYGDYINYGNDSGNGSGNTPANAPNQDPINSLPDC
jgi:hypothetical protein